MKDEIAEVKIKDLKKAYNEGCEDVKATLKKMYPDVFKEEWKEITREISVEIDTNCFGDEAKAYIRLIYRGSIVGWMGPDGFHAGYGSITEYKIEPIGFHFKAYKKQ